MRDVHAFLSASSSARWTKCPPSAKLCAEAGDRSSPYARQGTDAHSLCEYLLLKALHRQARDPTKNLEFYDQEMQSCAEGYRDFVMDQIEEVKVHCKDPYIGVEQRLDFSRWVPGGFGTGDCVIVADGILHIVDFKYGVGILVSAEHNSQLSCYALGAYDALGDLYDIETIKLSIYQPRREHIDTWETNISDLLDWAENVLSSAAKLAINGEGEFQAGDHCQFCSVKATCRARSEYNLKLAKKDFKQPNLLNDDEIAEILDRADSLISWAGDVKDYALGQALNGKHYPGFKIVEGRSTRKYTNDEKVAETVKEAGYNPYEKKLKGITAMTSELGKKHFNELLGSLIYKPPGKPVLVRDSDKRPEFHTEVNDFKENEEKL